MLPQIHLPSPTTPQVTHAQSTTSIVQTLDGTKTNTQTQKDAPSKNSESPLMPTPHNPQPPLILKPIPAVEQPNPPPTLCRNTHRISPTSLPCVPSINPPPPLIPKTQPALIPTPPNIPIDLESTISAVPNLKESHPKIQLTIHTPIYPTITRTQTQHPRTSAATQFPNSSCSRHNPPLRLQQLQPKSPAESVQSTHWPAHPTPRHTAIHKLIPTRQTTITLEFLSQPQPESAPSPPNDPKPTTIQEQTKESRPTVSQPDPPPTRCRDHYRADPAPLPRVAVISPPPDGCDAGHRTITSSLHSVSTNLKLSSPAADLHLYCSVAQNPDEVHRSSYVVWFTGKGKGRIFLCLVPKPKTRGLALAREEKRTEFPYRWFKKRKKKRLKEKRRLFPWSKEKKLVKKKKKGQSIYFILFDCVLRFHIHNSKNKRQNSYWASFNDVYFF
jgi:hypothetical protein